MTARKRKSALHKNDFQQHQGSEHTSQPALWEQGQIIAYQNLILSGALDKLFASKVENAVVEIPYLAKKRRRLLHKKQLFAHTRTR
jgi:hypothetical protein